MQKAVASGEEPEGGIGSFAIGMVLAGDHVGEGTIAFKLSKGDENSFGLGIAPSGNDATEADEGIASPVEKPGIAGDDGLELFALNDEGFDSGLKHVFKGLRLGFVEGEGAEGGGGVDAGKQSYWGVIDYRDAEVARAIQVGAAVGSTGLVDRVFDLVVPFGFDCKGTLWALYEELSFGGRGEGESIFMSLNSV